MKVFGGILEAACLCVHLCVCVSVCQVSACVQNTSFCQSDDGVVTLPQTSPGFYVSAVKVF